MNMHMILHEEHPALTPEQWARVAHQLALSAIAQDVASELVEAYELNSSTPAGFTARRQIKALAERTVQRTQPSAHENALGAAHRAQRETILMLLENTARLPKYADHSSADLIRQALTDFAAALDRIGPNYVIAAYEGSLEAGR